MPVNEKKAGTLNNSNGTRIISYNNLINEEKVVVMDSILLTERLFSVLENDFNLKLSGIDRDISIFEQLPLDSMQLVAIAVKIEETFGIELPLTFMEKPTINHLVKLVADTVAENNRPDHERAN